jgi:BirA family transcriptional regulator, biotin operon repressor / biotin---[acetyl-CoA-carboxylase] ligase
LQNNIFSGLFVGQNLVTLPQVDSTNTFLKNRVANSEPLPEGTVIMAEDQLAGRGQQQNKWFSAKNQSLTCSILLKPDFLPLQQQFNLNRVVSLGIYDALLPIAGYNLKMKWPNDVYIGNRKLGGVLIENLVQGQSIKYTIIGIGLNVNQTTFPEWVPNPVSLRQILQTDYDIKALMFEICRQIERWYIKLKAGNDSQIREAYEKILYKLHLAARFKADDVIFDGTIVGVSADGLLQVEREGNVQTYNLKEIKFLNID